MALIGMIFIVAGWAVQLVNAFRGKKEIAPLFLISYIIGVILLIIPDYIMYLNVIGILNGLSVVFAGLVLYKIISK
ncbi:MAG: hypothetical protein ISS90_00640 [Candidatus Omnitrophica bacterium]|nr:hypothetical protein [Candidatus Omnitrophota bacterium]